jgi:hypothetical protein
VNIAINLQVPQIVGKFMNNRTTGSLLRRAQLNGFSYPNNDRFNTL